MTDHNDANDSQPHDTVRADLPLLASGDLSASREEAVHAHLAGCQECQLEWEQIQATVGRLHAAAAEPPSATPGDLADFFETRLAPQLTSAARPAARRTIPVWVARAAVVLVAFVAGMMAERSLVSTPEVEPQTPPVIGPAVEQADAGSALDRAYEASAQGQSGLTRGLLALRTLRNS